MSQTNQPLPILLVEDNEIDIEITERIFARSGAAVRLRIVRDGDEALDVLLTGRPANASTAEELPRLVLLDLRLPRVEGTEVLKKIKEDPDISAIPVAILSGASGERPLLECMALGANMYYVKPISASDATKLVAAVEKYWSIITRLQSASAARKSEGRQS
jgi:CheY-like chemotaxis protein